MHVPMTTFIPPIYDKTFGLHVHFDVIFQKIPRNFLYFSNLSGRFMLKLWKCAKCIENKGLNKHQYWFANISKRKARILMKFYVVVNYYLVISSLKFHEDLCINTCTPVVNARAHVLSRVRAFTTRARAFMHGSS